MSERRLVWLLMAATLVMSVPAVAQSPPLTIGYAGFLLEDTDGDDLPASAVYDINVAFYEQVDIGVGEVPVWTETHVGVEITDGAFALNLGVMEPLTREVLETSPMFIEFTIDGDVMRPRTSFNAVPFARLAEVSRRSDNVGGVSVNDIQVFDENGDWTAPGQTMADLECDADEIPVRQRDDWDCGVLNENEDAVFALGDQACTEGMLATGFDDAGAIACADYSTVIDQEFLTDGEYVTTEDVAAMGFYSADNLPDWSVVEDVPGPFTDGDNVLPLNPQSPFQISGSQIRLNVGSCTAGQNLTWTGSAWQCRLPRLDCTNPSVSFSGNSGTVNCAGGYTRTGCGFTITDAFSGNNWNTARSVPSGNGCTCYRDIFAPSTSTCYARCCRILF